MSRMGGRAAVVSISDGGALTAPGNHYLRPWRLPALLMGAAVACIAALALATLPAPTAPSTHPARQGLQSHQATRLPITLAPTASASIGASEHRFWPSRHGDSLLTKGGGIQSTFAASGATLRVPEGTLGFSLTAIGRGQRAERTPAVAPTAAGNQVLYRHHSVSEFYRNGPYGLEQGFNVSHRPTGAGSLVLALSVAGSLVAKQVGSQVLFRTHAGVTALRYGQLSALDATGRKLPAQMQVRDGSLQLRIDDSEARYPLRIDPFIQQGPKLTGSDEIGKGQFGIAVALSSDGNTALIGGNADNDAGAAWVFTRSGSTWTQQGPKLTRSGKVGFGNGQFGSSVALSADGNTALIGAFTDNEGPLPGSGAAWVFTRSGSAWTQQSKLSGGDGVPGVFGVGFGFSVALSSDGNTALVGGTYDNELVGAAWVFTRSGSVWTQQGPKLTGSGEVTTGSGTGFGYSVALSSDGNTALIGNPTDNRPVGKPTVDEGSAWFFTRSGSTWTQQGEKLTGDSFNSGFGASVALSADGNTALIGAPGDNEAVGAARVFSRSGSSWTEQGPKLTGTGEIGHGLFGNRVALSSDGNTALIGAPGDNTTIDENGFLFGVGAAWVFTRSGTAWTQQGAKLTGSGGVGLGEFGFSVALSSDARTALIGGVGDNHLVGAAWVFVPGSAPPATTTSTSLSGGGQSGPTIAVSEGTAATDNATLNGEHAASATGKVAYKVYSDKECTKEVVSAGTVEVTAGKVPPSNAESLSPGTYYWQASYTGDATNAPSKSECGSEIETVTAGGGGHFVIGDKNAATGTNVTFWGAQWWKLNSLSGGSGPAAFKGFEDNPAGVTCGQSWISRPGNSTPPPRGPLPAYIEVIVASKVGKSGSAISGDTVHVVLVKTNSGYAPNPGHAGTGTVIATIC